MLKPQFWVCLKIGYPIPSTSSSSFSLSKLPFGRYTPFSDRPILEKNPADAPAGLNFFYPGKNEAGKLSFASTSVFESSSPFPAILFAKKRRVEFQHLHFSKKNL